MSSYTSRKVMENHVEMFFLQEKMSKKFWLTWKTCQKVDRFVSKENSFFHQKHHQTQFLLLTTYIFVLTLDFPNYEAKEELLPMNLETCFF